MTVEEFLEKPDNFIKLSEGTKKRVMKVMIGFAKCHVQKALESASIQVVIEPEHVQFIANVNKDSILDSYPLENIK